MIRVKAKNGIAMGFVIGALLWGISRAASADPIPLPQPELVGIEADQLFAPPGFDSNDSAQVVLHGEYMNTCYRSAPPEVAIDRERKLIEIVPQAYLRSGCWCAPVTVAFTQPVDLGVLPAGKYRVVERGTDGKALHETTLKIAASAATTADDFLYAPVSGAQVIQVGHGRELAVSGTFSSDCLELQEIRVLRRSPHIVEVLPIAKFTPRAGCDQTQKTYFRKQVKLPDPDSASDLTLYHIRLLNGQAINLVD